MFLSGCYFACIVLYHAGFYLPEYQPHGPVGDSGLVGPEAQLGTAPLTVRWLEAMSSLVQYGLTRCGGHLGEPTGIAESSNRPESGCSQDYNSEIDEAGPGSGTIWRGNRGILTYNARDIVTPPAAGNTVDDSTSAAVVDDMALLLTAGRLSDVAKAYISQRFRFTPTSSSPRLHAITPAPLHATSLPRSFAFWDLQDLYPLQGNLSPVLPAQPCGICSRSIPH